MMSPLLAAAALALPTLAQVPPPPPVIGTVNQQSLLAWLPGEVRCGGAVVRAMPMRRPWNSLSWGVNANLKTVTYGFAIDATGRTVDIHRLGAADYVPFGDDLAPSLAATHFAAGVAKGECSVSYVPRQTALAATPVEDLLSYTITPLSGALPEAGWARIRGTGTCADFPRPAPLVVNFPDYRSISGTPGVRDWSMIVHDLDGKGRPTGVHVAASTGNAALDAAAVKAMTATRFSAGTPRRACHYPYARAPLILAPPPVPDEDAVRPAGATCPAKHAWSVLPTLRFPEAYRRRAIEGWAIVTYDVAPWGEIGNAHVVAAEPTDEFGTQALNVVRSAKVPTTEGLVGCVDRVRFKMPDIGDPGAAPAL